jgi:hypothetical protein
VYHRFRRAVAQVEGRDELVYIEPRQAADVGNHLQPIFPSYLLARKKVRAFSRRTERLARA